SRIKKLAQRLHGAQAFETVFCRASLSHRGTPHGRTRTLADETVTRMPAEWPRATLASIENLMDSPMQAFSDRHGVLVGNGGRTDIESALRLFTPISNHQANRFICNVDQ
ncbi:hypothetical protein, partial [Caballeronia catudaia]|uniref:hypothetical protein n=1 Tax=Caballeronia catudaia TaxID=1777136 RepID=UPI001F2ED894